MPMPIMMAHKLARQLASVRKASIIPYLRPDGKSQVTIEYVDRRPVRIDQVLLSSQHQPNIPHKTIFEDLVEKVILPVLPAELLDERTRFLVNPTGVFALGGPQADTGLTDLSVPWEDTDMAETLQQEANRI